jgi:hypothetical protein
MPPESAFQTTLGYAPATLLSLSSSILAYLTQAGHVIEIESCHTEPTPGFKRGVPEGHLQREGSVLHGRRKRDM